MDITSYSARLHRDLYAAGQLGGEDALILAEKMAHAIDASIRLVLLDAMVEAAGEITQDLTPGAVEVRLLGREVQFAVTPPVETGAVAPTPEPLPSSPPASDRAEDEGGTARLSLRLPERLKAKVEEAAAEAGLSVNAWLVRAVAQTVETPPAPRPSRPASAPAVSVRAVTGQRISGWVR